MKALPRKKSKRGKTIWRGLVRDAETLGVHHNHLWLVLSGRRESRTLIPRYKALLKSTDRPIPAALKHRAA